MLDSHLIMINTKKKKKENKKKIKMKKVKRKKKKEKDCQHLCTYFLFVCVLTNSVK